ncbi:MAG: bifunctional riboflavin kinase/FAD synthetase [Bacteroidetes bacterium]|nr:bifunctional riboflavin kinase/FAD synthetase [Bacteroidota bacterium]MDA0972926.1 bifunctional riboflavin kinase/FAD synthetase [Bacteroidota bacterium]
MRVHTDIERLSGIERPILTIGTFDGVHHGHRIILQRIMEIAKKEGGQSVLLTFHPHPRSVVNESNSLSLLNTLEEKLELLEEVGLDHVIVMPFTKSFSRMSALEYVRDLLVNTIKVHCLVVGYDHHFGRNREGDIKVLKEYAELFDFRLEEIPAQTIDEVKISSTKIRTALRQGDVEKASEYLGYAYYFSGTVVHGDALGRTLGFPTANILPDDEEKLIPGQAVYAVQVEGPDWRSAGMTNIGLRPTIGGLNESPRIEVNMFDRNEDLYGKVLKVHFIQKLREEMKFPSTKELTEQLGKDRDEAKAILGHSIN